MQKLFAALTLAIVAAAAAGVFVLSGNASAASETVSGRGVLYARGSGVAEVQGDGRVDIRGYGAGAVHISGAESIDAQGEGRRTELPDGSVLFTGWKGTIHAAGDDMTVRMEGAHVAFRAAGEGTAFLKGRGQYRVGHFTGPWSPDGITVEFGPA
jgi:hypothetical protein